MVFSFLGDLAMANRLKIFKTRIINGVILFGIAHVLYAIVFWKLSGAALELYTVVLWLVLIVLFYPVLVYSQTQPKLINIALFTYTALISMVIALVINFVQTQEPPIEATIFAIGGILSFAISDLLIAVNQFKQPIVRAELYIAITYIPAQIALQSVLLFL